MFTIVAVLTIALGIGANAAIFTLMEAAAWKSLAVRNPRDLRLLTWVSGPNAVMNNTSGSTIASASGERARTPFSFAVFSALQSRTDVFDSLCAFKPVTGLTAVID